jgi:polyribonucleotide nucleotidyltransferase
VKLAETNLFNAKLQYTNKLLQSESLTSRQKAAVIKQLDEAKTLAEVKLVYVSLTKTLARRPVTENKGRQVLGSSSRTTRPASTQTNLNEGYEAERWARLAGINK